MSFLAILAASFSNFLFWCSIKRCSRSRRRFSLMADSASHVKSSIVSSLQALSASSQAPNSPSWQKITKLYNQFSSTPYSVCNYMFINAHIYQYIPRGALLSGDINVRMVRIVVTVLEWCSLFKVTCTYYLQFLQQENCMSVPVCYGLFLFQLLSNLRQIGCDTKSAGEAWCITFFFLLD